MVVLPFEATGAVRRGDRSTRVDGTGIPARALHRAACGALGTSEVGLPMMRPILEQQAAERSRTLGPLHHETLSAENGLGLSLLADAQDVEATDHLQRLAGDCAALLGPDHPDTLVVRGNLAVAHLAAGRVEQACTDLVDVVARRTRVLGAAHDSTLNGRLALALALLGAGRAADAAGHLRGVLDVTSSRSGTRHPLVRTCRALLGGTAAA